MNRILIISAHPDDEVLGAGGTMLRHKKQGDELHWLIVTRISEEQGFAKDMVERRKKEIEKISKIIGFAGVHQLDYPTMSLSSQSLIRLIPDISKIVTEIKPDTIYTMNRSDAHSDHRIIFDAVAACTKSFRYPFIKKFLMYETLSETEFAPALPEKQFIPNYYVDISAYLDKKIELMKVYQSELGEHPFPRSIKNIEALASLRGAFAGVEYAEAFQIVHFIEK